MTSAARATNNHAPTCRACGVVITAIHWTWYPKYCNDRCRAREYHARTYVRTARAAKRKAFRARRASRRCIVCKADLTPPHSKFCSRRCSTRWHRPGGFIRLRDLIPPTPAPAPSNDVHAPTRWTIVRDLPPCDGEDMALCRCTHGHEQAVAIDLSPPPDCERCDEGRDRDVTDLPEVSRLMRKYRQRLPDKVHLRTGRPTKRYDQQTTAAICALMHLGLSLREACRAFNLSYWTVHAWYLRGRNRWGNYRSFYVAVEAARTARRTRFRGRRT